MNMSSEEKTISFLNRFCIFKKVRAVDAEKVSLMFMNKTIEEEKEEERESHEAEKIVKETLKKKEKKKPKKLSKKLVLKSDIKEKES